MLSIILQDLGQSFFLIAIFMAGLWYIQTRTKNAGIVDLGWALSLVLLSWLYFGATEGYGPRRFLIVSMVTFWGLRLVFLLLSRLIKDPREDARYQKLRDRWKTNINFKLFFFFECQALVSVLLSIPFLLVSLNFSPRVLPVEWLGFSIWLVALIGEAKADEQLQAFKKNPRNKGKTCRMGLWNYSRHPNYFFEWMVWVGFAVFALGSPYGELAIFCPGVMLYFLLRVSGVPLAEAQALRSRGEEYRAYQRTTSVFIPWFPKEDPRSH